MASYATVEEYRLDTGDEAAEETRVEAVLKQQSAKLRAILGIDSSLVLTEDQETLARFLVTDAARKALVAPSIDGIGCVPGISETSFSANGFQGSYTLANPSSSAYFDGATLKALKKSLGCSQRIGMVLPSYGSTL